MKIRHVAPVVLCLLVALPAAAGEALDPIKTVEVGRNRELRVNGEPFLPVMLFAQSPPRIPDGLSIGVNTFVENGSGVSNREFLDELAKNGLYGVMRFEEDLPGHPGLLGYIHLDEPDNRKRVSDAEVTAGEGMNLNPDTPLMRLVDGDTNSWTVFDPLEGSEITIKLKNPATAESVAVWLTISGNLSVAKDVVLLADGEEILQAALENRSGQQKFDLKGPATFTELTFRVLSRYAGEAKWGSVGEIEGFDKDGKNVLLSRPRIVPKSLPEEIAPYYRKIKEVDPTRPVFVTLCAMYMKEDQTFGEALKARIYPEYMKLCDVAGTDYYPIFGENYPSRLDKVARCVEELVALGGPRPVFIWLETNTGSRWITPSLQVPLKPMHTRAEVWMSVIRGATAIGYFTHRWEPDYKQFAPEGEMVVELKRINEQLTRLAPAILADPATVRITMSLEGGLPCHYKATVPGGQLYIFAQNIDIDPNKDKLRQGQDISPRGGKGTITVAGLPAGTKIEVVDEDRTIVAGDGRFTDDFAPLAEHIYRLKL